MNVGEGQMMMRSALGRNGFIGELYDVRTESLTSRSLFKSSLPPSLVQRRDLSRTESEYKFTDNISDRFELLNVEAELQVSVLSGLIEARGSGKFFTEGKKSGESVTCSLVCKFETVSEKLVAPFDEILAHVDLTALEDSQYTHVIVEETWGANCLMTLEAVHRSESEKKQIEGELKAELTGLGKLLKTDLGGSFSTEKSALGSRRNLSIKVYADVVPEKELPSSIETFRSFVLEIPGLLQKTNQGKGKPLNYAMIPLSWMRKTAKMECAANVVVRSIDESFLLSIVCLFEEIAEVKQRLYALVDEMAKAEKYVRKEDLRAARNELEKLRVKESELKLMMSKDLVGVRSGEKSLRDLVRQVEKFKSQELKLYYYDDYLESASSIRRKLFAIENYASLGVAYLGRAEKFSEFLARNSPSEFFVLVTSSELEEAESEGCLSATSFFVSLVKEPKSQTMYAVLDLEFSEKADQVLGISITAPKVFYLNGPRIVSSDVVGEYLASRDSNFLRLKQGMEFEVGGPKPGNRVALEMACPGFQTGSCGPDKLKWLCFRCKCETEFGFDDHFYCSCGRAASTAFDYRCGNPKHGDSFLSAKTELLKQELSTMRSLKELNILILGQSGVGKSTWINSIINYLAYESLEEARKRGVICEIPASFTIYDSETRKNHVVTVGKQSDREDMAVGNSATQFCHTYSFLWEENYVRLIDTPGLGDVRGIDQDKKNMEMIINFIGHLKELHGVCILVKANENRLHAVFSYCIKELLCHMHKSVARNIVFCFTNARNSFYLPGQSSMLLDLLLEKIEVKDQLALGRHNMFCLDNEAFLFLCTLGHPSIRYDDVLVTSFAQSWEISRRETYRLFCEVKTFVPHQLRETLSLATSRHRILSIMKPIAEISKTIQANLSAIERKRKEIETSNENMKELCKKLKVNVIRLVPEVLSRPRTVCTRPSCVEYHHYGSADLKEIEYKSHCHVDCRVENVEALTVGNLLLKNCLVMKDGKCKICGCGWQHHMHLRYSQRRVEEEIVDVKVESDLSKVKSEIETVEEFVLRLEEKTAKYKSEQEFIIQTSVKFGMFLKSNAISVYNDTLADYLQHLIKEEEDKPCKSKTEEELLKNLKVMLKQYEAEVLILTEVINSCAKDAKPLTPAEVFALEQQLYKLELTGTDIKRSVEANRKSTARDNIYAETPLPSRSSTHKKSFVHNVARYIQNHFSK